MVVEYDADEFASRERSGEVKDVVRDRRPRHRLADGEGSLVVRVESAWEHALLVQIFIGYSKDQVASRPNKLPPFINSSLWVVHVLKAVRRIDVVKFILYVLRNAIGVSVANVESSHVRSNGIWPATYVDPFPLDQAFLEVAPYRFCLCSFVHILNIYAVTGFHIGYQSHVT